jgi:hypothetical protein
LDNLLDRELRVIQQNSSCDDFRWFEFTCHL